MTSITPPGRGSRVRDLPAAADRGRTGTADPNRKRVLLVLLVAIAGVIFTPYKLYRMAQIRGFIGESRIERQVVSAKTRAAGRVRLRCYLWWNEHDARRENRVEADCDDWEQVRIGDAVDIVRLDDENHQRRGSVYASDGNFVFDFVLLAFELATIIYCVRRLARGRIRG